MKKMYKYSVFRSGATTGVAVFMDCEVLLLSDYDGGKFVDVGQNLSLAFAYPNYHQDSIVTTGTAREIDYFKQGLMLVYDGLMQAVDNEDIVVKVIALTYPIVDFQDEGLAYAIASWVIQNYELELELPEVTFDKEVGRYIFPHINEYLPRSDGLSPSRDE